MISTFTTRAFAAVIIGLSLSGCANLSSLGFGNRADIYLLMGQSNMSGRGGRR